MLRKESKDLLQKLADRVRVGQTPVRRHATSGGAAGAGTRERACACGNTCGLRRRAPAEAASWRMVRPQVSGGGSCGAGGGAGAKPAVVGAAAGSPGVGVTEDAIKPRIPPNPRQ